MSALCPVCGEGHITRDTWKAEFEYQGTVLFSEHTEEFCDACGTSLQTPEMLKENARSILRAKLAYDGLLNGEEIKEFRDYFGITQKTAAALFGGGPTAFAKYESNEIAHNVAMDRLLRLCKKWPDIIGRLAQIVNVDLPQGTKSVIRADLMERLSEICKIAQLEIDKKAVFRPKVSGGCANDNSYQCHKPSEVLQLISWRNKVAA